MPRDFEFLITQFQTSHDFAEEKEVRKKKWVNLISRPQKQATKFVHLWAAAAADYENSTIMIYTSTLTTALLG